VIEERFSKGDSVIHIVDPRVKIVYALLYSLVIALSDKLPVALSGFFFASVFIVLARLNIRHLLSRLLMVNVFILLLWLILPFSFPGNAILTINGLRMTEPGVLYSLLLTVKCNAIILVNIGLISTCGIFKLVHAFRHLGVPDKLIHLFFFLYRYAHVLMFEYAKLRDTLKIRGFKPSTSMHTYKTYGAIIGTLLLRGYERSEQIHKAMICRGFKGKYWLLDHFKATRKDILVAGMMLFGVIGLGVLQWTTIV
jgi:cobalt/nickel transport system permease protein